MSLFMERGVHQVERELRVLRLQLVAVRERQSVGYHSSPLWLLVGLEPSSFARIGRADQHRQGHEDRECDLDPLVGYQVHVHLLSLVFEDQPASSPWKASRGITAWVMPKRENLKPRQARGVAVTGLSLPSVLRWRRRSFARPLCHFGGKAKEGNIPPS